MTKALILGVTGQDGTYLSEFLLKKNYDVFGTFRRTSHKCFERLEEINIFDQVHTIKADLADQGSIQNTIKQSNPDEIYNLAAQSFVGTSFEQPILTSDITGLGTLRVLEAIKQVKDDVKFYQASSSEMFGNYSEMKNEHSPFLPRSPYGVAKVFAHNMVNHYREAYDLFASCGILFNHESPLRGLEFVTRRISYELAQIKFKKKNKIHLGNLRAKRDWGFAGDYVEAMWLMMQQDHPDDYVIATGESHSVEEFLSLATEIAGLGDWHDFVEIDKALLRPTDIEDLVGNSSKASKELGWKPKVNFKQLVKMMVEHDIDYFRHSV
ncbi:MAG: GDP-mannose 4,6-dehydratase [Thaumarchaeota archaeon]|nr:MAG: GDP-mannose 4,6-dehydratase [Nitrososphaerota archaeon]